MSPKSAVFLGMMVGSILGGYIPTFFGAGLLSFSSALFSGVGGLVGIYIGYKLTRS